MELEDNRSKSAHVKIDYIEMLYYSSEDNSTDHRGVALEPISLGKVLKADGTLEELDLQIASMMERAEDKLWTCKLCGKKATKGGKPSMRDHIEANQIEGIQHCCDLCGKIYK